MFKALLYKWIAVVTIGGLLLIAPRQSNAQPNLPSPQVVELSGIEPPPAGMAATVDVGGGGGGFTCDSINVSVIAGSGFTPPITPNGFGLYIDCIKDISSPLMIYFFERGDSTIWNHIAARTFYPSSSHTALLQVKLTRSFPIDISRIGIVVTGQGQSIRPSTGMWGSAVFRVEHNSRCVGSLPVEFLVEDGVDVGRSGGLDLLSAPDQFGEVLANVPFGTHLDISDITKCGADGKTYWAVQHNGLKGWLPQGDLAVNWLVSEYEIKARTKPDHCDGTLPSTLAIGQRARIAIVDGTPASVRSAPLGNVEPLVVIPELTPFTIVRGPWCGTNNRGEAAAYWLVRLDDGTKGWVIEVTSDIRVIEPIA
jgi:hypothetical protein